MAMVNYINTFSIIKPSLHYLNIYLVIQMTEIYFSEIFGFHLQFLAHRSLPQFVVYYCFSFINLSPLFLSCGHKINSKSSKTSTYLLFPFPTIPYFCLIHLFFLFLNFIVRSITNVLFIFPFVPLHHTPAPPLGLPCTVVCPCLCIY